MLPLPPEEPTTRTETPGPAPDPYAARRRAWSTWLPLVAALVLWVVSLARIDLAAMTALGLIAALPATYFLALAAVTFGFVRELFRRRPRGVVLGLHIAALVVILHGVIPILYEAPHYSWVYKHIGLTRYFETYASARRPVDIYQNWTGFFVGASYLSRVTGVDAMTYTNWAQLFFACCDVLAVRFAVRSLTRNTAVVALSVWIYILADWVGQNYFSPQALGFLFSVTAIGLVLRFPTRRPSKGIVALVRRRASAVADWIRRCFRLRVEDPEPSRSEPATTLRERTAVILVLVLLAVVVISHPLSPFFLTAWLAVAVVLGRRRLWWLPIVALAATLAWSYLAREWLTVHVNLFHDVGNATQNATPKHLTPKGPRSHELVSDIARALSMTVWGLAAFGFWRRIARHRDATPALLALVPFPLVLGQSYGGEAIYRIYLFALPWVSLMAAWALLGTSARPRFKARAILAAVLAAMTMMFLVAYFGLERTNHIQRNEIEAVEWFGAHAPSGTILVSVGPGLPTAMMPNYYEYFSSWGQWGASMIGGDWLYSGDTSPHGIDEIVNHIQWFAPQGFYVLASPSQELNIEDYGMAPRGTVWRITSVIQSSPNFRLVYEKDSVLLFEYVGPPPAGPAPGT